MGNTPHVHSASLLFYLLTFPPPYSGLTFKVFYKWRLFPANVVAEFHCVIGNARESREV